MLRLELATPERPIVSEHIDDVMAPGADGYFGVLPGHAPLLSSLRSGEVRYHVANTERYLAVHGGFVEVRGDRVIILADSAERPEEIDRQRAERAHERAEQRLAGKTAEEIDYPRAMAAWMRAQTRLLVADRARR